MRRGSSPPGKDRREERGSRGLSPSLLILPPLSLEPQGHPARPGPHGISRLGVWRGLWPLTSWVPAWFARSLVK